jgi:hypothetical protein
VASMINVLGGLRSRMLSMEHSIADPVYWQPFPVQEVN